MDAVSWFDRHCSVLLQVRFIHPYHAARAVQDTSLMKAPHGLNWSRYSQMETLNCTMSASSFEYLPVPQIPICAATISPATLRGEMSFLTLPSLIPTESATARR